MEDIKLNSGEMLVTPEQEAKAEHVVPKFMDFTARLLTPGIKVSEFNGEVEITPEDVIGLCQDHNLALEEEFLSQNTDKTRMQRLGAYLDGSSDIENYLSVDISSDHIEDQADVVKGRLKGKLWLQGQGNDDVEVWGTIRVLGVENVPKVLDTRLRRLSVNFRRPQKGDPKSRYLLREISFVPKGADTKAMIIDPKTEHSVLLSGKKVYTPRKVKSDSVQMEMISLVTKGIEEVDRLLLKIREDRQIDIKLKTLVVEGKLAPRFLRANYVQDWLGKFSSHKDREVALDLMSLTSPQVNFETELDNMNAIKATEMLMSAEVNMKEAKAKAEGFYSKSPEEQDAILKEFKSMKLSSGISMGTSETANGQPKGIELNDAVENDDDRYLQEAHQLMESGNHDEAKEKLSAYIEKRKKLKGGKEEAEAPSDKGKEDEEKLSATKDDLRVILSELINDEGSELSVKLSKITDSLGAVKEQNAQNETLLKFAATIADKLIKEN